MADPPLSVLDPAWSNAMLHSVYGACDVSLAHIQNPTDATVVVQRLEEVIAGIRKAALLYPTQTVSALTKRGVLAAQAQVAKLAYRVSLLHEKTKDTVPAYLQQCRNEHATGVDAITGVTISVDEHPVAIGFTGMRSSDGSSHLPLQEEDRATTTTAINNVQDLCSNVFNHRTATSLVLINACAGTGKTFLCRQTARALSLRNDPLCVPLLVPVQKVAQMQFDFRTTSIDPLEDYIRATHDTSASASLIGAYRAGCLVAIFDGLDEAPSVCDALVASKSHSIPSLPCFRMVPKHAM